MIIKIKYYISFILAFIIAGCSGSPELLVKTDSNQGTISAAVNKEFIISIEGQLSTGYAWKLSEIPAHLILIRENTRTEEKDKAGGIDIQQFVLKSSEKGNFNLVFNYAKHWEKKPKYIKTTKINVKIE